MCTINIYVKYRSEIQPTKVSGTERVSEKKIRHLPSKLYRSQQWEHNWNKIRHNKMKNKKLWLPFCLVLFVTVRQIRKMCIFVLIKNEHGLHFFRQRCCSFIGTKAALLGYKMHEKKGVKILVYRHVKCWMKFLVTCNIDTRLCGLHGSSLYTSNIPFFIPWAQIAMERKKKHTAQSSSVQK